jgi:nicotinic acid phosphoribosyltransferase
MDMARLPVLQRRRSKRQRALDLAKRAAKVWTAVKVSTFGARTAKKGAKAYGAAKAAKVAGRPLIKVAAVPVAVAGGVVVWRKVQSGSSNGASADAGRSMGPVAHAESVSPPSDAAAQAARSDEVHAP